LETRNGFLVFLVLWDLADETLEEDSPVYTNLVFPELPPSGFGLSFTGIPCNYSLLSANVTFSNSTGVMRASLDSALELYENNANHTIAQTIMQTSESLRTQSKWTNMMFLFDLIAHGNSEPTTKVARNGTFYEKKLSELLAIPVYSSTRDAPFYHFKGERSVAYTKIHPADTFWGVFLILVWCCSCFFLWLFAMYLGPRANPAWHSNLGDNSWNYLYTNLSPQLSDKDTFDENATYFQDPETNTIIRVKVERVRNGYPGRRHDSC
jgi:hypothetical protein